MNSLPIASIKHQDDLPPTVPGAPTATSGTLSKEKEGVGVGGLEIPALTEFGQEVELPTEVTAAGVRVQPTTVILPPHIQSSGLKPTGVAVPLAAAIALPLTDDQIAAGLHQGITSSWRWLAEWCLRKLKQLHIVLKSAGGVVARTKN